MPNNQQLVQGFEGFFNWIATCLGLPMTAPVCRPLWEWTMYASAGLGAVLVVWFIWRIVNYRLKYNAAIRAQAERERVAEPEVMEQHKFKEAGDLAEDVTDPHLAAKIRAELDRQRLEKISGRAGG